MKYKIFYKKIKRIIKHPIEYALFIIILKTLRCLGIDKSAEVCSKVARFIGPYLPYHQIAQKNLKNVFGENIDIDKTIDQLWDNCGRFIGEFPFVQTMSNEESAQRVKLSGIEHIQQLIDKNQPFIFFTGHFANWEMALKVLNTIYPKFAIIYRKSNNRFISKYINDVRVHSNYFLIPKGTKGARDLVKAIKLGYSIGILVDQKLYEGSDIPFFGRPAKTATGVAEISLRFDYPIIPFQIIRTSGSYFQCIIHPPLHVESTGDKDTDCYNIMLKVNQTLESWIIQHKEQWFWFHNRW